MITIKNTQRTIQINITQLRRNAQKMLAALDYGDFDLGIWLTTNATIRRYNKKYRSKDKPTDILSFPYYPNLKPGKKIRPKTPEEKNLGDIIISLVYVKRDASRWDQTFLQRLNVLLAHGIAHLVGYEHQTEKQFQQMQKLEKKLLSAI